MSKEAEKRLRKVQAKKRKNQIVPVSFCAFSSLVQHLAIFRVPETAGHHLSR